METEEEEVMSIVYPKVTVKTAQNRSKGWTNYLGIWHSASRGMKYMIWFQGFTLVEIASWLESNKKLRALDLDALFTAKQARKAQKIAEGSLIADGTLIYPEIQAIDAKYIFTKDQVASGMRKARRVYELRQEIKKKKRKK
jgi:hypothetical protein